MRTNLDISNDALQLILVHNTEIVSSFQAGGSKSIAIQNGWRDVQRKCLFFLGWILFNAIFMRSSFGAINTFGLFGVFWAMGYYGIAGFIAIYSLFKPRFVVWDFNRTQRQLTKTSVNVLNRTHQHRFSFDRIQSVEVIEHQDSDSEYRKCTELFIRLQNKQEFTLSQSGYSSQPVDQKIALKHHLELAENMRDRIGLANPQEFGQRSQDIKIRATSETIKPATSLKHIVSLLSGGNGDRDLQISNLRQKLAHNSQDVTSLEKLALLLIDRQSTYQEGIEAYQQTAQMYREMGYQTRAADIEAQLAQWATQLPKNAKTPQLK
jgi:hypothetical protein